MLHVQAIYENGVLKPDSELPLREHERVELTVQLIGEPTIDAPSDAEAVVRRSQGLLAWTGDTEALRQLAESAEFDPQEGP